MTALIKERVGATAVVAGIVGTLWGVGLVEAAHTAEHVIASIGVAATSLMVMYAGVELVRDTE